jgi:hypothetical protein
MDKERGSLASQHSHRRQGFGACGGAKLVPIMRAVPEAGGSAVARPGFLPPPAGTSGDTAGLLWFTMLFVEGESLSERLRREPQLSCDRSSASFSAVPNVIRSSAGWRWIAGQGIETRPYAGGRSSPLGSLASQAGRRRFESGRPLSRSRWKLISYERSIGNGNRVLLAWLPLSGAIGARRGRDGREQLGRRRANLLRGIGRPRLRPSACYSSSRTHLER